MLDLSFKMRLLEPEYRVPVAVYRLSENNTLHARSQHAGSPSQLLPFSKKSAPQIRDISILPYFFRDATQVRKAHDLWLLNQTRLSSGRSAS